MSLRDLEDAVELGYAHELIELMFPEIVPTIVIQVFSVTLARGENPPLKPPIGLHRHADAWFKVHEAWFVNKLLKEGTCLRSKK